MPEGNHEPYAFPAEPSQASARDTLCELLRAGARKMLAEVEWVTEWVSRHVMIGCRRLLSDLLASRDPRPRLQDAM